MNCKWQFTVSRSATPNWSLLWIIWPRPPMKNFVFHKKIQYLARCFFVDSNSSIWGFPSTKVEKWGNVFFQHVTNKQNHDLFAKQPHCFQFFFILGLKLASIMNGKRLLRWTLENSHKRTSSLLWLNMTNWDGQSPLPYASFKFCISLWNYQSRQPIFKALGNCPNGPSLGYAIVNNVGLLFQANIRGNFSFFFLVNIWSIVCELVNKMVLRKVNDDVFTWFKRIFL